MLSMSSEINQQDKPTVLPPKSKQDALVSGYIRESIILYPFTLPICLIKLCLSFFNTIQYFKFEKETLTNFLNSTKDDIWEGKSFNTHGIMFRFVLSPADEFGFFVKAKCLSTSIRRMVIKATFFCHETGEFYTNTKQRTLGTMTREYPMEIGTKNMISISDCKDKKCLTFSGKIEVLRIYYESHLLKPVWSSENIQMRSNNVCKWMTDGTLCRYIDNTNWLFCFYSRVPQIYLRLLNLPINVVSVAVKCNAKVEYYNDDKIVHDNTLEFDWVFSLAKNTHYECFSVREIKNLKFDKALIDVKLIVYEIFTRNCVSVQKRDWEKHGIIN